MKTLQRLGHERYLREVREEFGTLSLNMKLLRCGGMLHVRSRCKSMPPMSKPISHGL